MTLNYEKPKYNPVQTISEGYTEKGKSVPNENNPEVDLLREQFKRDPESLSSLQRLTLGFAELNAAKEAKHQNEFQKLNNDGGDE